MWLDASLQNNLGWCLALLDMPERRTRVTVFDTTTFDGACLTHTIGQRKSLRAARTRYVPLQAARATACVGATKGKHKRP